MQNKNREKQCPNCGGYKTYPVYSIYGLMVILLGSCFGCVFFFILLPVIPVFWVLGLALMVYDWYLIARKKERPFKCQSCGNSWKE